MKSTDNGQMLLSIGALLASEREKKGIAIEKASKETRMRVQRLRDIENDDFSQFSDPSYARMFIIAYAKYLGVSMDKLYEHLPERGAAGSDGYQYMNVASEELPKLRPELAGRRRRGSKLLPILATLVVVVILGICGAVGFYLWVNLPRLTASGDLPGEKSATVEKAGAEDAVAAPMELPEASEIFTESVAMMPQPSPAAEDLHESEGASFGSLAPPEEKAPPIADPATNDRAFLLGGDDGAADASPEASPAP